MNHYIAIGVFVMITPLCAMTSEPSAQTVSWPGLKGDLRFRHETVDQEDANTRNMARLRARVNLTAKASEKVTLVFGVASGQTNEPIAVNQTLTGGFSDKPLWIDLMYFDWAAGKEWLHVTGGKMKNPFFAAGHSQIVWDQDVNPEGFAVKLSRKRAGSELFANGAFFWVEERPTGKDSYMAGVQTGVRTGAGGMGMVFGGGFFDWLNARGYPTFCDPAKSYGNSIDAGAKYLHDYRIAQLFGEMTFSRTPVPVIVFAELANNVAEDVDDNTAWVFGFSLGKLVKPGSWTARWLYQYTERDAVVGAFTNSEFGGSGANVKGHAFGTDIQVSPKIIASTTCYLNKRGVKNGLDYRRFVADMTFRF